MPENFLTVDDAAKEIGVHRVSIWKAIRRLDLPTFRFLGERRTFLRREDVDQLRAPIPIERAKKVAA
jgi:excisionase family DNA binding protein